VKILDSSNVAHTGTANCAGLAPRTDRRAHANPSDWSGRDSNNRCSARRECPRAIATLPTLGALGIGRASIRSIVVTRAPGFFQTSRSRVDAPIPTIDPIGARRAWPRYARVVA